MSGGSVFSKIVAGEIPCQRVFENDHVLAFLDINPLAEGHTLVIPKREVERFEDLRPEELSQLANALQLVVSKVLAATGAEAYNILQNNGRLAGQEVPHVHFHIIPRATDDGLGYRWRAKQADAAALEALAERMRSA